MLVEAAVVAVLMQKPCPVYRYAGTLATTAWPEQSFRPVKQMPNHILEVMPQSKIINLCVINRLIKSIFYIAALVPL